MESVKLRHRDSSGTQRKSDACCWKLPSKNVAVCVHNSDLSSPVTSFKSSLWNAVLNHGDHCGWS
jgi:hypothetical protein